MSVKRLDTRRFGAAAFGVAMALATSASAAHAQLSGGQWRLPPQGSSSGRTAVEKKPEPTIVADPLQHSFFLSQPVAFTLVPAILMSDGSVFANFGAGFEPVLRPCNTALFVGQPRVIGSNGVVLFEPAAPTYTQPVPNQQTASQQMVSSSRVRGTPTSFAQFSCFGRNAAGGVFVMRF